MAMTGWVATTAQRNGGTASTYLSGALRQREELGVKEPAEHAKERRKIIKAATRAEGKAGRDPIYATDLSTHLRHLNQDNDTSQDDYMALAAATTALCAGLRVSDYAPDKATNKKRANEERMELEQPRAKKHKKQSRPRPMRRSDVEFGEDSDGIRWVDVMVATAKGNDTADFFKLHETVSKVDAYTWIKWALRRGKSEEPNAPLFSKEEGAPLDAGDMRALTMKIKTRMEGHGRAKRANRTLKITPHSLRVGAARSMLLNGCQRPQIDAWLRWKSQVLETSTCNQGQRTSSACSGQHGRRGQARSRCKAWRHAPTDARQSKYRCE
jgi:hypothetical protein